jgi:tetratricopeptide (TPR) repeat protein
LAPASAHKDARQEPAAIDDSFELEAPADADEELSSERILSEFATGFDDVAALLVGDAKPAQVSHASPVSVPLPVAAASAQPTVPVTAVPAAPVSAPTSKPNSTSATPPRAPVESSDHLHEVFEEFRAELGEIDTADEDIETHYNLGVAYREMGLLEEAISEFQKVAKASDRDQAFRYALQCCTLLGLSFMEKGHPAIAALWYQRALRIPDLDHETQLALHYDLGVSLDLAGDAAGAQKSFAEVYATNIDYRDVAERLAALEKAR